MGKRYLIFIFFSLILSNLYGQEIWDIMTISEQPYTDVVLHKVSEDTLYVNHFGETYTIVIDSIESMTRERDSKSVMGGLIGVAAGGAAGYYMLGGDKMDDGFFGSMGKYIVAGLGMIIGGIVGAGIGGGLGQDEYYDFEKRDHEQKVHLLNYILERQKNNKEMRKE